MSVLIVAVMVSGERMADLDAAIGLRERLLRYGAHTLTDAELVSVLLAGRAGVRLVGCLGLARCHPEALCRLPGLGEVSAARLVAALALPPRRNRTETVRVSGPAELVPVPVFSPVLAGVRHERLAVAVCDRRLRVKAVRVIADGASDGCAVSVRDLLATVLRHDGYAFAIGHNHPSGDPMPASPIVPSHCAAAPLPTPRA